MTRGVEALHADAHVEVVRRIFVIREAPIAELTKQWAPALQGSRLRPTQAQAAKDL